MSVSETTIKVDKIQKRLPIGEMIAEYMAEPPLGKGMSGPEAFKKAFREYMNEEGVSSELVEEVISLFDK